MTYKFTNRANKAIELANDIALDLGHSYIGTEHILYGLAKEENGVASKVLENQNVTAEDILNKIEELIGRDEPIENIVDFTPRTKRVVEVAFIEARKLGYNFGILTFKSNKIFVATQSPSLKIPINKCSVPI